MSLALCSAVIRHFVKNLLVFAFASYLFLFVKLVWVLIGVIILIMLVLGVVDYVLCVLVVVARRFTPRFS